MHHCSHTEVHSEESTVEKKKRVATEYMGICGGGEELENYESWLHYCKAVTLCVSDKTTQTVHKKGSNLGLWLYLK